MTYLLINIPFLLLTILVVWLSRRRPHFRRRMIASAAAAVVLVILTAVFDNIMIALDLFTYPDHLLSGIRVGLAPIEDFAYPVAAAFLLPALYVLIQKADAE